MTPSIPRCQSKWLSPLICLLLISQFAWPALAHDNKKELADYLDFVKILKQRVDKLGEQAEVELNRVTDGLELHSFDFQECATRLESIQVEFQGLRKDVMNRTVPTMAETHRKLMLEQFDTVLELFAYSQSIIDMAEQLHRLLHLARDGGPSKMSQLKQILDRSEEIEKRSESTAALSEELSEKQDSEWERLQQILHDGSYQDTWLLER